MVSGDVTDGPECRSHPFTYSRGGTWGDPTYGVGLMTVNRAATDTAIYQWHPVGAAGPFRPASCANPSEGTCVMAKRSIVSIYEVDAAGQTGAPVGEGSLIAPFWVFIHPPLSKDIAAGLGPRRVRLGLRSDPASGPLVEVIDGADEPTLIGVKESVGPLVAVKLRVEAKSPYDEIRGLARAQSMDQLVEIAVSALESQGPDKWGPSGHPGSPLPMSNVLLCQLFRICC